MAGAGYVDAWKLQEVVRYLETHFTGARVEDYPRGIVAHLFVVTENEREARSRKRHHLVVTRQFFNRFPDPLSLRQELGSAEVARALTMAGERSIDLY